MSDGPLIQHFSLSAGDAAEINFDVDPDSGVSLLGATPYWLAYEQDNGVPDIDAGPVLKKVLDNGLQITDPDLLQFQVILDFDDTKDLLGNYYHEAFVIDADDRHVTTTVGIMTIKQTATRDFTVEELP